MTSDQPAGRIKRGATGFQDRRSGSAPRVDPAAVRRACWAVAGPLRATAVEAGPGYPASFTCTELRAFDGRLLAVVVAHLLLPIVTLAAASPVFGDAPKALVPQPAWAEDFVVAGFQVLDDAALRTPLREVDLSALPVIERKPIRRWKPAVLGELLFNWWD
ncbi:hypothetical protein [Streptacidiphilus neutrinimicus]|uniref:hypothetical protein n=1 Tax=Streptacidiphilus neutrinimicus TaxID=105420 RepID=UPI001269DF8E|nr:hypothetical protein [Streptacidiphilus neutrinimicus]